MYDKELNDEMLKEPEIRKDIDLIIISRCTDLSIEEVEKLKKEVE